MIRKLILASVMTTVSAISVAGTQSWDFPADWDGNPADSQGRYSIVNGGDTVKVDAWSSTGSGCGTVAGNGTIDDVDSCIESAQLKGYSGGLGVINNDEANDEPNHAIDNTNHGTTTTNDDLDFDMVMFTFDEAVNITSFGTGWQWGDFDASVVAYTGTTPFSGFGQSNWSDILDNGWSLVDEGVRDSTHTASDFNVADDLTFSTHWLVGTFNSAFSGTTWTDSNDGFKLNGLTVMTRPEPGNTTVNAPAMLALILGGFAFMMFRRKS